VTTEQSLTAAVLASPDDDLPRLVFADWYEENGDPERAEFVRLQCALARPHELTSDRLNELLIREKVLIQMHAGRWLDPLRQRGEPLFSRRTHAQFRRGFVEVVWMPAAWFLKKANGLFARCPVRELRLTQVTAEEWRQVLTGDHFTRLEALDLSERRLGNAAAGRFVRFAWPGRVSKLKRLRLRGCGIDDDGAETLAGIPETEFAPVELDLGLNPISEAGQRRLRYRYGEAVRFA
jgi:uncharacterized protein (TIGR02996 family)